MSNIYNLVWFLSISIAVFALMFYALQKVDYSKIFKANSTFQIKIVIVFLSLAISFACALGVLQIMQLIEAIM